MADCARNKGFGSVCALDCGTLPFAASISRRNYLMEWIREAITVLKAGLQKIPNMLADPAPCVEILTLNLTALVLVVRPFCNNKDYWRVYFETNILIKKELTEAGFSAPGFRLNRSQILRFRGC